MGVLDKWLRGTGSPDRGRKPAPYRPASTIGSTVRERQTTPTRPASGVRPAVPVKRKDGVPAPTAAVETPTPAFDDGLQKKLDRYFERLRAVYPNGVISRLNTGQKKLAERGAQLRKLCGMENELDAFFALGGFTYERTAGGRPRNVQSSTAQAALVNEVKALFPNGIASAAELDRADHALYLRLRSAARLSGGTITAFLNENNLNIKGEKAV